MATKPKDKLPLKYVKPEHMEALATVLATGVEKYGEDGYLEEDWRDIESALLRHLMSVKRKGLSALDPESTLPHVWHILASAAILVSLLEKSNIRQYIPEVEEKRYHKQACVGCGNFIRKNLYTCPACGLRIGDDSPRSFMRDAVKRAINDATEKGHLKDPGKVDFKMEPLKDVVVIPDPEYLCHYGETDCKHEGKWQEVCYNCYRDKHKLESDEDGKPNGYEKKPKITVREGIWVDCPCGKEFEVTRLQVVKGALCPQCETRRKITR